MNVLFRRVLLTSLALLATFFLLVRMAGFARHLGWQKDAQFQRTSLAGGAANRALEWGDRFGDGTPNFLRLNDPADQAAFRHWFTLIAEYQAIRPKAEIPPENTDCASLLRFSYRETLKRHNDSWFLAAGMEATAPPSSIGTRVNEAGHTDLTAQEVRFTTKGDTLYALVMGWPDKQAFIRPLATTSTFSPPEIQNMELLGYQGKVEWRQDEQGITVVMPEQKPCDYAIKLKIV